MKAVLLLVLLALTGPNGQHVYIAASQVVSIVQGSDCRDFTKITLSSATNFCVRENADDVARQLKEAQ